MDLPINFAEQALIHTGARRPLPDFTTMGVDELRRQIVNGPFRREAFSALTRLNQANTALRAFANGGAA